MCGRFAFFELLRFLDELGEAGVPFVRDEFYHFMPGYNIAPESTLTVLLGDGDVNVLSNAHWGLVPHWAESMPKVRPVNARAESIGKKPYFRHMLNRRHCLIPASGFYEWSEPRNASPRHPFYIHRTDGRPMALAGLWDRWQPPGEERPPLTSCTIITTAANPDMRPIHQRMPVILEPETWQEWLDAGDSSAARLLRPAEAGVIGFHRVSRRINNPQYIRKDGIAPVREDEETGA
jgi:putative SOS response-associated peptidase YedK